MKIRQMNTIKSVALAVAAFALASPAANAQQRLYSPILGRSVSQNGSRMANNLIYNNGNGYYGPTFGYGASLNNYNPSLYVDPSGGITMYGSPYGYRAPGAVVLGPNGQVVDTTPYPFVDPANGVEDAAAVAPNGQNGIVNAPTAQLSDQIAAVRLSDNRVKIAWAGDPRPIASMTFSLLDSRRNEVRHTDVSGLPAQAIFTRPSNAAYYAVTITYSDGAVRRVLGSL